MNAIAMYSRRIRRSLEGCRFKPSMRLCMFEEGFSLDLLGFLIALPFLDRWLHEPEEMMESWGVYLNGGESQWKWDSIVLCWGDWTKFIHMPWEWRHIKHEVLRADGIWTTFVGCWEHDKEPDGRQVWKFPFTYTLKNGQVQHRTATISVERREWRRKFIRWMPLFSKRRQSLDISFSDEVGERTGSWKGGTIGCGWDIQPGESVEQSFARMQRDRVFD